MIINVPDHLYKEVEKLIKDKGANNAPDNKDIDKLVLSTSEEYVEYWGEEITTKRNWQSSPDHPKTFLAYITVAEAKLLRSLGLGYSLIGGEYKQHYDNQQIPSFNGYGVGDSDYGGEQQSAEDAAGTSSMGGSDGGGSGDSSGGLTDYAQAVQDATSRYEASVADITGADRQSMIEAGYSGLAYSGLGGEVEYQSSAWADALNASYTNFLDTLAPEFSRDINIGIDSIYTDMAYGNIEGINIAELANISTPNVPGAMNYNTTNVAGVNYNYTTRDLNLIGMRTTLEFTTTTTAPNMLGGYDVVRDSQPSIGLDTTDSYTTNMKGEIVSHNTTVSIGTTSFSYDTHYWDGNNEQYGFVAEAAADISELFGARTSTVKNIAAAAEVFSVFFTSLVPSIQALSAATSLFKFNSTMASVMAIGAIMNMYDELNNLSNKFTGYDIGWDNPNNSLSNAMLGNFDLGGETYELGDVVEQEFNNEIVTSLLGSNLASMNNALMPNIKSPTRYIQPKYNEETNMQSQQAVFIDYRGGLSEILAPNLIGANEGSVFSNININRGTMQNQKIGEAITLNGNKYTMFLPNGYIFSFAHSFNAVRLGNFIYMTIDNPAYAFIYQLDYNSLDRDCNELDLVIATVNPPTSKPSIVDNLVSKVIVNIDTDDDDSPADTSNNVKKDDIIAIYYGDVEVKRSIAMTDDDIDASVIEIVLDTYYPESDEENFSYKIVRSDNVINPESNDLTLSNEDELESELWEEYVYAYTYYDSDSGFESAPIFSDSFLKKSQAISIEDLEYTSQPSIDYIRLYRIGGYSSSYRLIAEIANSNTVGTTTYTDASDEEYVPTLLDTQNLTIVPDLVGLIEHKGTLFAFKNNQVYFSRPGKPNMWSNFNSVRVGGVVSGLASTPLGVLIFTENSQTYILGGTDKYSFTLSTLTKTVGCVSKQSINNYKNTAIWLDYEGIMMSVGSSVTNISKEKVNLSDIGDIIECMVYNNVYYLLGENYTLTIDFKYNTPSFQKLDKFEHIIYNKGKIYIYKTDSWYENAFDQSGTDLTMHYKAPKFIGNSYDILTEFEKVNLTYKGHYTFKVYVDEVEVLSDTISSNKIVVEEIKIPTEQNEGLGLEFELIGAGEIRSFRYIFSNVNIN